MEFEHALSEFQEQGFTVIPKFFDLEEVESLKKECAEIVDQMNPSDHCSIFETGNNQIGDDYFINSGDKISFFFEKDAVDENGKIIVDKRMSLNKIGHALHWLNPVFKKVSFSQKVKDLFRTFCYKDPVLIQSMYIFKNPGIGGEVVPHQDSTFLYTKPLSALGLWFPLEDATEENGCLWFIPGSHKGPVYQRFMRNPGKKPLLILKGNIPEKDKNLYIPVPAKKGDCIVIHGSVFHKSGKNVSAKPRPVYTFHIVEQRKTLYSDENWLQETAELPFQHVYQVQDC